MCAYSLQNFLSKNFQSMLNTTLPQIKNLVSKRKRILNFLKKINLKFHKGNSTFYIFLDLSNYSGNINNLALYLLLEKKISVVPGFAYGQSFKKFIRISIGTETEDRIFEDYYNKKLSYIKIYKSPNSKTFKKRL